MLLDPGPNPNTKTLKDEFAMVALQGILANPLAFCDNTGLYSREDLIAEYAYEMANAMINERKKL